MNLVQLRAFVAVVEHDSFSEAARSMGLSQPAVTMQVQGLEATLGATLLERRYRRIELTEAGEVLLPHVYRILEELEAARADIEALSDRVTGRLVLASSTTPGEYVLPRLLGPFLKRYPEVSVTMLISDTTGIAEAVESGDAHLGMAGAELTGMRVAFEPLGSDRIVVVSPPDHPLAARTDPVPVTELAEQAFIMRESGSGTRLVTEQAFRDAGIEPGDLGVITELGTGEAIVSAVEGGMGLAVLSRYVAEKALKLGTVAEVPAAGFPIERPFYVVTARTTPTRAASAFLDYLRESLDT